MISFYFKISDVSVREWGFFFIVNVSFGERDRERERESTRIVEICFYNYFQKK